MSKSHGARSTSEEFQKERVSKYNYLRKQSVKHSTTEAWQHNRMLIDNILGRFTYLQFINSSVYLSHFIRLLLYFWKIFIYNLGCIITNLVGHDIQKEERKKCKWLLFSFLKKLLRFRDCPGPPYQASPQTHPLSSAFPPSFSPSTGSGI